MQAIDKHTVAVVPARWFDRLDPRCILWRAVFGEQSRSRDPWLLVHDDTIHFLTMRETVQALLDTLIMHEQFDTIPATVINNTYSIQYIREITLKYT